MGKLLIALLTAAIVALFALSACTPSVPYSTAPTGPDYSATVLYLGALEAGAPGSPGELAARNVYLQQTAQALEQERGALAGQIAFATAQSAATERAYNMAVRAQSDALALAQQQGAATATAQALALEYQQTATAAAFNAQATMSAATAQAEQTRGAAVLAAQAQGTAQAKQAKDDARAEQQAASAAIGTGLLTLLVPIAGGVAGLAFLTTAWRAARLWIDNVEEQRRALALRSRVIETRAGTYAAVELEDGSYTYQALPPMAPLLPPGLAPGDDEFTSDAAPAEYPKVNGVERREWGPIRDPVQEERRRMALRLLRTAIATVGPNSNRLPGHRELNLAADVHDAAKKLLAPYLTPAPKGRPRKGEESGARLVGQFVTLAQLYNAVGSRLVRLGEGEAAPAVRTKAPAPAVDKSGPCIVTDRATGRAVIVAGSVADELMILRRAREAGIPLTALAGLDRND